MGVVMSDYKELLDALDGMDFFCDRAGKELWFDKPKEVQDEDIAFHHKTLTEAISAIEQLCADVARLEAESRAKEQYIAETIGKVIKERDELKEVNILLKANCDHFKRERDAAIADLKVNWLCAVCKKRVVTKEWMACKNKDFYEAPCEAPTCLNFEWRGLQEVEHENA